MRSCKLFVFITLSFYGLNIAPVAAQIFAPGANFSDTLEYPVFHARDPYFIFHTPDLSGAPVYGSLVAQAPSGSGPWNFEWSLYDTLGQTFNNYLTENNVNQSLINDLETGCYRVHITGSGVDEIYRAWVFRNRPGLSINKNAQGKVPLFKYTCDYLILEGEAIADQHAYYDLTDGSRRFLANGMQFEWSSDTAGLTIPFYNERLNIQIFEPNIPARDTYYYLRATDSFGLSLSDTVLYESVVTVAAFEVEVNLRKYEKPDGSFFREWEEGREGPAPLEARFINRSLNGDTYRWTFADSSKLGPGVDVTTTTLELSDTASFIYYIPRKYFVTLVSVSEEGCESEMRMTEPINVQASELEVPKFFTPNNDGTNDLFIIKSRSLKEFRIGIFNKAGKLVYEYEQTSDTYEWDGWDGRVGNSDNFAAPGIYYYVIRAIGWDAEKYQGGLFRGYFYIFR